MTYNNSQQFLDDCNRGLDIEFAYGDYKYTVLSWFKGGPLIGRPSPLKYLCYANVLGLLAHVRHHEQLLPSHGHVRQKGDALACCGHLCRYP